VLALYLQCTSQTKATIILARSLWITLQGQAKPPLGLLEIALSCCEVAQIGEHESIELIIGQIAGEGGQLVLRLVETARQIDGFCRTEPRLIGQPVLRRVLAKSTERLGRLV